MDSLTNAFFLTCFLVGVMMMFTECTVLDPPEIYIPPKQLQIKKVFEKEGQCAEVTQTFYGEGNTQMFSPHSVPCPKKDELYQCFDIDNISKIEAYIHYLIERNKRK